MERSTSRAWTLAVGLLCLIVRASDARATICLNPDIELERVQGIVMVEYQGEGEILPEVTLTLERRGARFERVETSDEDGFFAFRGLPDGDYELTVQAPQLYWSREWTVRVRRGSNLGQVLVVRAGLLIGSKFCGSLEMTSARSARRIQQDLLHRRNRLGPGK